MSKSASMSTDTLKVKGKKQKSQILQAMVEALYRFNPKALFGSPILFTLWLAAVMASVESLLGQPVSGVAPSLAWQLTAWLWLTLWFANFAETLAEGRGKGAAGEAGPPSRYGGPLPRRRCKRQRFPFSFLS